MSKLSRAMSGLALWVALAAVAAHRERFAGKRVGVVLSGGNLDVDALLAHLPEP